jgi:hypothetical protein
MSERRVDRGVDVVAEVRRVEAGQAGPARSQFVEWNRRSLQSNEACDRFAGPGDGQLLAALGPFDDLAAMVPEIPDRDIGHSPNVSRVIRNRLLSGVCSLRQLSGVVGT